MQIKENHAITIHYEVKTENGDIIDSSVDKEPVSFIQGSHFMIQGIEDALYERLEGETFTVNVPPEKAYGMRHETLVQEVPISMFEGVEVDVGMSFRATTDDGEQSVIIIDKNDESVTVDGNHPLAGLNLVFDITVIHVRQATEDEVVSGNIDVPDCCKHSNCSELRH